MRGMMCVIIQSMFFFFQAEDGIRYHCVTGVQTCALPILFVHLHPAGTISLAALETFALRQPGDTIRGALGERLTTMQMGRGEAAEVRSGEVTFPYAFPKPGRYRIWVQVKRTGRILTGAFDADVDGEQPEVGRGSCGGR